MESLEDNDPRRTEPALDPPRSWVQRYRALLNDFIWSDDLRSLRGGRRLLIRALRFLYVLVRDLLRGELNLRAMGLVYSTLLSLVPLLAVSFSVLKAFGVHNQLQPLLYSFLEPLGEKGKEIAEKVVGFVENIEVGVLGAAGVFVAPISVQKDQVIFDYYASVAEAIEIPVAIHDFPESFKTVLSPELIARMATEIDEYTRAELSAIIERVGFDLDVRGVQRVNVP